MFSPSYFSCRMGRTKKGRTGKGHTGKTRTTKFSRLCVRRAREARGLLNRISAANVVARPILRSSVASSEPTYVLARQYRNLSSAKTLLDFLDANFASRPGHVRGRRFESYVETASHDVHLKALSLQQAVVVEAAFSPTADPKLKSFFGASCKPHVTSLNRLVVGARHTCLQPCHVDGETQGVGTGASFFVLQRSTSLDNGATEVWPDSAGITPALNPLDKSLLSKLKKRGPSIRLVGERGDVWALDLKTYHRGTANPSLMARVVYSFMTGDVEHAANTVNRG